MAPNFFKLIQQALVLLRLWDAGLSILLVVAHPSVEVSYTLQLQQASYTL